MNITHDYHEDVLKELLRVTKNTIILIEYNWKAMKSSENPELVERFRKLAFEVFSKFSTDPYMGEKFKDLFNKVDPKLNFDIQSFKRREAIENIPELLLNLRDLRSVAKNIIKDEILTQGFEEIIKQLEEKPIKFAPPEIVAAIIKK